MQRQLPCQFLPDAIGLKLDIRRTCPSGGHVERGEDNRCDTCKRRFQNRSLATVRDLLRIVFSRNTGKETRLSLNQSRITEHDKEEMLTLHEQGETVQAMLQ